MKTAAFAGGYGSVKELTFAEAADVAESKRFEEWDRVAFIATRSIYANPLNDTARSVRMSEQEVVTLFKKLNEDG